MRRAIVRQGYRPVQGFLIGEGVMRRATTRVQASTEYLNRYQVGVMRRATRVQASTAVAFLGQSVSDWRGFSSQPLSATTQLSLESGSCLTILFVIYIPRRMVDGFAHRIKRTSFVKGSLWVRDTSLQVRSLRRTLGILRYP